jgi:molybdopterin/thiamine biosynthesis adenylyltransferase
MTGLAGDVTLAIRDIDWKPIAEGLERSDESAWVGWARLVQGVEPYNSRVTLLLRGVMPVAEEAYELRTADRLSIRSSGWLPGFAAADQDGSVPIFIHTHPGADPVSSELDEIVDDQLAAVASARNQLGDYGSLVIGADSEQPTVSGKFYQSESGWRDIGRLRLVGERLHVLTSWVARTEDGEGEVQIFDRQIRAFGAPGQALLKRLRVGVVGAGGTGSSIAEQLIRLGVSEITVIDGQNLDGSNVTRIYGSTLDDSGKPKGEIVSKNAAKIGLGTTVSHDMSKVTAQAAAKRLAHCDVVLGCTDDHAGRAVLTRMPLSLLQLLIDCGVKLDSRDGTLKGIYGRVSIVAPGDPCLVCHGDVDPDRLRDEMLAPDELAVRQGQGYAAELDEADPAVITYTTMTSSLALNEMLGRVFGFTESEVNHLLVLAHDRRISRQRRDKLGEHRCGDASKSASGLATPFLDWAWGGVT